MLPGAPDVSVVSYVVKREMGLAAYETNIEAGPLDSSEKKLLRCNQYKSPHLKNSNE